MRAALVTYSGWRALVLEQVEGYVDDQASKSNKGVVLHQVL